MSPKAAIGLGGFCNLVYNWLEMLWSFASSQVFSHNSEDVQLKSQLQLKLHKNYVFVSV